MRQRIDLVLSFKVFVVYLYVSKFANSTETESNPGKVVEVNHHFVANDEDVKWAYKASVEVHNKVYDFRHQGLLSRIDALDPSDLELSKVAVIRAFSENEIGPLQRATTSNAVRKKLSIRNQVLAELNEMSGEGFKDTLKSHLLSHRSWDTFGVAISEDESGERIISVSANTRTRVLEEMDKPNVWLGLAQWRIRQRGLVVRDMDNHDFFYDYVDFGLNFKDALPISEVLNNYDWIAAESLKVVYLNNRATEDFGLVTNFVEISKELDYWNKLALESSKSRDYYKALGDEVLSEPEYWKGLDKTTAKTRDYWKELDKDLVTDDYSKTGAELITATLTKKRIKYARTLEGLSRVPHSEVAQTQFCESRAGCKMVLGTSKVACGGCQVVLEQKAHLVDYGYRIGIVDTTSEVVNAEAAPRQNVWETMDIELFGKSGGLELSKVKSFRQLSEFTTVPIEIDEDVVALARQFTELEVEYQKLVPIENRLRQEVTGGSDDDDFGYGGCARRRRAISSCVRTLQETEDGIFEVGGVAHIRSKEFIQEYLEADSVERSQMSRFASAHEDKLSGSAEDIEKVHRLIEYENLVQSKAKMDYSTAMMSADSSEFDTSGTQRFHFPGVDLADGLQLSPSQMVRVIDVGDWSTAQTVSGVVGKVMLAKSVVIGVMKGDGEGLALMGWKMGGDKIVTEAGKALGKFAPQFLSKMGARLGSMYGGKIGMGLSKAFSGMGKALGKVAGPLGGAVVDIGFSAWGLSSSIARLKNPNATKFDQNDAIADIVNQSIDIAIAVTVTALSIALPMFQPLIALVGFFVNLFVSTVIKLYKAQNHVDRLSSQIDLFEDEKSTEFGRNFLGLDTSTYLIDLIDTRRANALAVNLTLDFLVKNPDIIGTVIPSRNIKFSGPCRLRLKYCYVTVGEVFKSIFSLGLASDSTYCEKEWTQAKECYGNGTCNDHWRTCAAATEELGGSAWNHFRCECGFRAETTLGWPHKDSFVDLREQQLIWRERSAPVQVPEPYKSDFNIFCTPAATSDQGSKLSERNSVSGYLCTNAIGVMRNSRAGKFMLYDLEDGTDTIYLNTRDNTSGVFFVDKGYKTFVGGAGEDTFWIRQSCSGLYGLLDGGTGTATNTLMLGKNCTLSGRPTVHLSELGNVTNPQKSLNMQIRNIQSFLGGANGETVYLGCNTENVRGGGGAHVRDKDVIVLYGGNNTVGQNCSSTRVLVDNFSQIELTSGPNVTYVSIPMDNVTGVTLLFKTSYGATDKLRPIVIVQQPIGTMIEAQNSNFSFSKGHTLQILVETGITGFPEIIFLENNQTTSYFVWRNGNFSSYHRLDNQNITLVRQGCALFPNVFELVGGSWTVIGGTQNDAFTLLSLKFFGTVHGTSGKNSLYLSESLENEELTIDVPIGHLSSDFEVLNFTGIHKFFGRGMKREIFVIGCDTRVIAGRGGKNNSFPDKIEINDTNFTDDCGPLLVTVVGDSFTTIDANLSRNGSLAVMIPHLPVQGNGNKTSVSGNLTLNGNIASGKFSILAEYGISQVDFFHFGFENESKLELSLCATNSKFCALFTLKFAEISKSEYLIEPEIRFQEEFGPSSLMLLNVKTHKVMIFHTLDDTNGSRNGSRIYANYFKIKGGGSWVMYGGEEDDDFEISGIFSGEIYGSGGTNSLQISQNLDFADLKMDLENGNFISLSTGNSVLLENIQKLFGRKLFYEIIRVGCDTILVAGNGGGDEIFVPFLENCTLKLKILAEGNTSIVSEMGNKGEISVQIFGESEIVDFTGDFDVNRKNLQLNLAFLFSSASLQETEILILSPDKFCLVLKFLGDHHANLILANGTPNIILDGEPEGAPSSVYVDTLKGILLIRHYISHGFGTRHGAPWSKNQFTLAGSGNWTLFGGHDDDAFIVQSLNMSSAVHGGGGYNTLILTHEIGPHPLYINCSEGTVSRTENNISPPDSGLKNPNLTFHDLHIFIGRQNASEQLRVQCDTQFVDLKSGANDQPDIIEIFDNSNCTGMNTTIIVSQNTKLNNYMKVGQFYYKIQTLEGVSLNLGNLSQAQHFLEFQNFDLANFNILFNQENEILEIGVQNSTSNKFFVAGHLSQGEVNPTFQFLSSGLRAELRVSRALHSHLTASIAVLPQGTSHIAIVGFKNIQNELFILQSNNGKASNNRTKSVNDKKSNDGNVLNDEKTINNGSESNVDEVTNDHKASSHDKVANDENPLTDDKASFGTISGGALDDIFWLGYVAQVDEINGQGQGSEGNALIVMTTFYTNAPIIVDFQPPTSGIRNIQDNSTLVYRLTGIQRYFGRGERLDTVMVHCDTRLIARAANINILDKTCEQITLTIEIEQSTVVKFYANELFDENGEANIEDTDDEVFAPGIIFYHFKIIRSFTMTFDLWFTIRKLSHNYILAFPLDSLSALFFNVDNSTLTYVIENSTYHHLVDPILKEGQEFFENPNFVTSDGYRFQMSAINGEVIVTKGDVNFGNLANLQTVEIPKFTKLATRLNVTMILSSSSDFVYIGNALATQISSNVLTSNEQRSHLVGNGANFTSYVILDLQKEVCIYSGLNMEQHGIAIVQTVDLREIVSRIRNATKTKYVPSVRETTDGNLIIEMIGHEAWFPGKLILVGGVNYAQNLQVLLNAVMMKFTVSGDVELMDSDSESRDSLVLAGSDSASDTLKNTKAEPESSDGQDFIVELHSRSRDKRSSHDPIRNWQLTPFPIILRKGQTMILVPEDLEIGQKIEAPNLVDPEGLKLIQNEGQLVWTNIEMKANQSETTNFVLQSFETEHDENELNNLEGVVFVLNESNAVAIENLSSVVMTIDFEDTVEQLEEEILSSLPEVKRQFRVPWYRRAWKRYKVSISIFIFLAMITCVLLILRYIHQSRYFVTLLQHIKEYFVRRRQKQATKILSKLDSNDVDLDWADYFEEYVYRDFDEFDEESEFADVEQPRL